MALGWLGVGLGLASLLMPRRMASSAGMPGRTRTLRAIGLRELATGAGILLRPHKPGWLWSRVAGDAMDLGLLAAAGRRSRDNRVALASALVAGITVLDLLAAYDNQRMARAGRREDVIPPGDAAVLRPGAGEAEGEAQGQTTHSSAASTATSRSKSDASA